jgi:hypothetical protein
MNNNQIVGGIFCDLQKSLWLCKSQNTIRQTSVLHQ